MDIYSDDFSVWLSLIIRQLLVYVSAVQILGVWGGYYGGDLSA